MFTISNFITQELENRITDYTKSPNYILEHYEAEKQNIASYNGRQLLEMLQNADDAAKKAKNKKAYIELSGSTLRISNNGEKFDKGGFTSLMYIHRSGKRMKADMIGQKGLGFRSILSWAKKVIVESGGEQVAFSSEQAQKFLHDIISKNHHVREFLNQESKENFPIATLRIPQVVLNPVLSTDYDTSIIVELKNNILGQVKSQMKDRISMETMLFLKSLDEIELKCEGYHRVYMRSKKGNTITVTQVDVLTRKSVAKTWNIKYDKGRHKEKAYEIAVAWNDELDDTAGNIYTFFETKSKCKFPGILHATFELTPDRNHLIDDPDGHNAFLMQKIAELMASVAERIAKSQPQVSYDPLKLVNVDFEHMDHYLKQFGFEEMLLEAAKNAHILPTVNNEYIKGADGFIYYPRLSESLFRGDDVDDLLIYSPEEEIDDLLESFGRLRYSTEKVYQIASSRLGKIDKKIYAKMLCFLFENDYLKEIATLYQNAETFLPLFLDNRQNDVPWGSQLFMRDKERESFTLPPELNIRILDTDLYNCMEELYEIKDSRNLTADLKTLGIKEYNFLEIVSALSTHYKNATSLSQVHELHHYLFPLYLGELTSAGVLSPIEFNLPVIGQKKNIIRAHSAYFGKVHGEDLSEKLYRFDRGRILSDYDAYELGTAPEQLYPYFTWLGIAKLPRLIWRKLIPGSKLFDDFADYTLRGLDFRKPIGNNNEKYRDYSEFFRSLNGVTEILVSEFDSMEQILMKSRPEDIFLWIKKSSSLKSTLEENRELCNGAYLHLDIQDKVYLRKVDHKQMPSFVKWIVSQTLWLPVGKAGLKSNPDKCCMSKTITGEFSPFVERPSDSLSKVAEKIELHPDQFESYLVNCGVHREISSFSLNTLYGMLLALPKSDTNKKAGPSIYREIITNFNDAIMDTSHPMYKRFLIEGEVVCEKGGKRGYYPVSESYYIQSKKYGNNLLRKFPLIHIDRKRGPKKVSRMFGVQPLGGITFEINRDPLFHEQHSAFAADFARFKALVYTLRMDADTNSTIKNGLKKLRINLVKEIDADYIHNDTRNPMELEEFEFISKKNTYYILLPEESENEGNRSYIGLADAVAEILTDVIGTEEYRSFIRELFNTNELSREALLIRELQLEDNERILKAKMELNVVDDIRFSFWRAFLQAAYPKFKSDINNESGLKKLLSEKLALTKEEVACYMDLESYSMLNEQGMQEQIFNLFVSQKVKFPVFRKLFPDLEFGTLFKYAFQDVKTRFSPNFGFLLYEKLSSESLEAKKRVFEIRATFDNLEYQSTFGFIPDMVSFFQKLIFKDFDIQLNTQMVMFSIDERTKANIILFEEQGIVIPPHVGESYEGMALILFSESEALIEFIKNTPSSTQPRQGQKPNQSEITFAGVNIVFTDYKSLAEQILDRVDFAKGKIKTSSTVALPPSSEGGSKKGGKGKRPVRFGSGIEEQVGFIGELLAYHRLKARYAGRENVQVRWVSENAFRAEASLTGEAGKGYDIEFSEEGKVRYIEVKAVASVRDGFKITPGEIAHAQKFPDKYDLLIVENPLSEAAEFRYVRSAFKFAKGESILFNNKMKVLNDTYRIRFNWSEETK